MAKTCEGGSFSCGEELPLSEFGKLSRGGYRSQCRNCEAARSRAVYDLYRRKPAGQRICETDECDTPLPINSNRSRKFCDVHQTPAANAQRKKERPRGVCLYETCDRPEDSKGFCKAHYLRQLYGKDMALPIQPARRRDIPEGAKWLNGGGYVVIKTMNGSRLEHVVVMEAFLHRSMRPGETVHHKNTIRTDNRIENLEPRVRGEHPRGGALLDMVAWARALLRQLEPDEQLLLALAA